MTKTDQIKALLEQRFPCQAVPTGAMADIATELGCSRELVRQVANKIGMGTSGSGGRRRVARLACVTCGEPLSLRAKKRGYHRGCTPTMTVPCAWCGAPVTKSVLALARRARYSLAANGEPITGLVFCGKQCTGSWLGKTKGRPDEDQ